MSAFLDSNSTNNVIQKLELYSSSEKNNIVDILNGFASIVKYYNAGHGDKVLYVNQKLERQLNSIVQLHMNNNNTLRNTVSEYENVVKENVEVLGGIK